MALLQPKKPDECVEELKADVAQIQSSVFRGITIDQEYKAPSYLLNWTSGSNWVVDYYSQILAANQEPTAQNVAREPAYQQYRLLHGVSLKVNQALDSTQDERLHVWSRTGSGHTYSYMTPNVGDMFIAGIGDGRKGLFTITRATMGSVNRGSTYLIEWKQVTELTQDRFADLTRKVLLGEEWWYSTSSAISGCGPFVNNLDQQRAVNYGKLLRTLISNYMQDFFSTEHSTFLVPDQIAKTYDHWVTNAMIAMVDTSLDKRIMRVKQLNVQSEPVMKHPTVWDAIIRHDLSKIHDTTERAHLVSTQISRWRPELQAIGYTGIPRFVFPIEAPTDVDSQYDGEDRARPEGIPIRDGRPRRPVPGPWQTQLERDLVFFRRTPPEEEYLQRSTPWLIPADIHPVTRDTFYVFSESFYRCEPKLQSKLEMLATAMIKGEAIDKAQFDALIENVMNWDNLERFYYHPVVIALLKYAK